MNPPNLITVARAISVPFLFWFLMSGYTFAALVLFVAAGFSDALDGFLAKRFNWQTSLGAYLDPLADKLLLVSVFIALGWLREVPFWLVVAVVSRDILIVLAILVSWLVNHPVKIKPHIVSKANTVSQLTLAGVVLCDMSFALDMALARSVLVWTTAALTLASLVTYLRAWLAHMKRIEHASGP